MKRLNRLGLLTAALVLSVSSLLNLAFAPAVYAATDTCTWSGVGSDDNFSTAANWSGCDNGNVPENGDSLIFPTSAPNRSPNNDMVSASFAELTFTGTDESAVYTLSGNSMTVSGNIDASIPAPNLQMFETTIILGSNSIVSGSVSFSSLNIGNYDVTLNGYTSILGNISGTGDITVSASSLLVFGPSSNNSGWIGGSLTLNGNNASTAIRADTLPSTTSIAVDNGATLNVCGANGASLANPLSVGGIGQFGQGAVAVFDDCSGASEQFAAQGNVNWTGPVTLTSDTEVSGNGEFKISGSLNGAYAIKFMDGKVGKLVLAASPNNSQTSNGTYISAPKSTTYTGTNLTPLSIYANNIGIIEGTRGQVDVKSGGILKGTGTVGVLTIDAGGNLAPGLSPGCLNSGNLTLSGTYQFEVGGTTACSGYDQIKVTGTVNVSGGTLEATLYNGFVPSVGQSYTIIDNDGVDAVTGTFDGIAEGGEYTNQGVTYTITYEGGDGNDVVLTVARVNESELPGAPDTGLKLFMANPLIALTAATLAAGAILFAQKRLQKTHR